MSLTFLLFRKYTPKTALRHNFVYKDLKLMLISSIGSSRGVGGGKKHEIYVAAFGGHLFYDLFVQGWGGMAPSVPPLDPLLNLCDM